MRRGPSYRDYLYIDPEGIAGLLSQGANWTVVDMTRSSGGEQTKTTTHTGKGSLGLMGTGAEYAGERAVGSSRETRTEQRLVMSDEQLVAKIEKLSVLRDFKGIADLAKLAEDQLPALITGAFPMRLLESIPADEWENTVAKTNMVQMQADLVSLTEGWCAWNKILLGGSLGKFRGLSRSPDGTKLFGRTSHLGIWIATSARDPVRANVIAFATSAGNRTMYLKPFAIWR